MSAQHPIIKYRLTRDGRIPEYLCTDPRAFAGMYGVDTNTPGFIPRWLSPQETQFLGMGCGEIDPDQGAPAGVSVVETKAELQTYITGISTAWTVKSRGVTGVSTETTTGTLEAWNPGEDYAGPGLTTTTTDKVVTAAPAGTVVGVTTSYADSVTTSDTDGVVTKTVVRTFTETTEVENPFDPAAAADELWAKYEAVNEL
jgi:hypothetical protein